MLLHRSLSDGRHRQVLPGPCQPHQDPAVSGTREVRGRLRQGELAKIILLEKTVLNGTAKRSKLLQY